MKKKLVAIMLMAMVVSTTVVGCGKEKETPTEPQVKVEESTISENETPSDNDVTVEDDTADNGDEDEKTYEDVTVEMLVNATEEQFGSITEETPVAVNMYVTNKTEYSADDLYMSMAYDLPAEVMYLNMPMFGINAYMTNDTVYYFNVMEETWFYSPTTDETKGMFDENSFDVTEEFSFGKDEDGNYVGTYLGVLTINGNDYYGLEETDDEGTVTTYYYDVADLSLDLISTEEMGATAYLEIMIDVDVTIPTDVLDCEEGEDFNDYMNAVFSALSDSISDTDTDVEEETEE